MFDMIANVIKNLGSKPATRMYPFVKREPFKDVRGKVGINIDACIFCGICSRKCPSDAITVDRSGKSWEIDPFKCVVCGVCSAPKNVFRWKMNIILPLMVKLKANIRRKPGRRKALKSETCKVEISRA